MRDGRAWPGEEAEVAARAAFGSARRMRFRGGSVGSSSRNYWDVGGSAVGSGGGSAIGVGGGGMGAWGEV